MLKNVEKLEFIPLLYFSSLIFKSTTNSILVIVENYEIVFILQTSRKKRIAGDWNQNMESNIYKVKQCSCIIPI